MKLIIAIVQDEESPILIEELTKNNFRVTKLASTGGFLKSGNTTLLMGVEEERVEAILDIIRDVCKVRDITTNISSLPMTGDTFIPMPMAVRVGGATVFMVEVDQFIQI